MSNCDRMSEPSSKRWRSVLLRSGFKFAASLAFFVPVGCSSFDSAVVAANHEVEVVANNVRLADGLAFHPSGALLVTEEYRGGGVLRIDPVSGASSYIVRDLADPDNLVVMDGEIFVTSEDVEGRIVRIDRTENISTFAADLRQPEGLDSGPDGSLYVAEHWPDGNVYRFTPEGVRSTLGQVTDGEGLRLLPDGSVIVAETSVNRVSRFFPDGRKETVSEGSIDAPDGVTYDPVRDRLLVSEDAAPGRIVQLDVDSGEFEVVADGLHFPQTMLIEDDGSILVAEQGENRILRLRELAQ